MKEVMRFCCALLLLPALAASGRLTAQSNGWTQIATPAYHGFREVVVHDDQAYAVADGLQGIFSTTDDGATWSYRWEGKRFYVNEYNDDYYRIDFYNNLYQSTDQGLNWTLLSAIPFDPSFNPLLSFSGATIYTYIRDNLYRMKPDNSWELLHYQPVQTFFNCTIRGSHIWLYTEQGFSHSADGGTTWGGPGISAPVPHGLAAAGDTVLILYTNADGKFVFSRTTNNGINWKSVDTLPQLIGLSSHSRPFWAYDYQGNWYRSDNGLTGWERFWNRIGAYPALDLEAYKGKYLAATANGILYEPDSIWQYAWHGLEPLSGGSLSGLSVACIDQYVLALSNGEKLGFSEDSGDSWRRALAGELPGQLTDIDGYYVGLDEYRFLRCLKNSLFDWKSPQPASTTFQPRLLTKSAGQLYAMNQCCSPNQIFRSSDAGASAWETSGTLSAASYGHDVLLSIDGALFTRRDSVLEVSTDGGMTWTVRHQFDFPVSSDVAKMYAIDNHIFFSQVEQKSIYRSVDGGFTFQKLNNVPVDAGPYFQLRVHNGVLILNTTDSGPTGGLHVSTDLGAHWHNMQLPNSVFYAYTFANTIAANQHTVFLPDYYGNLWRYQLDSLVDDQEPLPARNTPDYSLQISPNPVTTNFHIAVEDWMRPACNVFVYNVLGEAIYREKIPYSDQSVLEITCGRYPPGLYQVVVQSGGKQGLAKIIKW